LNATDITEERIAKVKLLNEIARQRGQTMAQLALTWVLRDERITSVIIGASKVAQIEDAVAIRENLELSPEELGQIEQILG
jgi:L-glyceraldehyde 3-phosphate reductase